ncbi:Aspartyl protease inhibitor [Toxocara canis]|uniref:Aspartyl protease inhibitor n=1 Tax=Toxocara canis TaxID=6265 RepID=A0A0B2VFC3_TOXCA|nr:Aspartyl protease inhibitor [Toxocara canis]
MVTKATVANNDSVDKNVLYIDGIKMSTLTPSQQQELASYQQEMDAYEKKNVLYIDGIKMSTLTPSQQQELASYQQEMDAYEKKMDECEQLMSKSADHKDVSCPDSPQRPSFCNVTVMNIEGCKFMKMDECEQLMSKSADHKDVSCPDSPQRPSFCNVTVMNIEGCKFMDGKLYIHENLVRELTNEEKTKIAQFNEQYKKYMDYQNELLDQAEYDMDGNMIMNGTTMSDQQPAVPMPKNPKICTSF